MQVSYKKLWKLLIDRDLKKNDLRKLLSPATVSKLNRNKIVSFTVLIEICRFLSCDIGDIVEIQHLS
ncbi:MAG: helix-turn-helix transcriptional regulator [Oscillospiraceae bacterium]|nr:helix-turn-helix transcriptional regulator [Oscillospiraceae bacterium]